MAVPRLGAWVAHLLLILLSLGSGLDTLEGKSPNTVSWTPISTPPTPPGKPGGQTTECPAGAQVFTSCNMKAVVSSQKDFPPARAVNSPT